MLTYFSKCRILKLKCPITLAQLTTETATTNQRKILPKLYKFMHCIALCCSTKYPYPLPPQKVLSLTPPPPHTHTHSLGIPGYLHTLYTTLPFEFPITFHWGGGVWIFPGTTPFIIFFILPHTNNITKLINEMAFVTFKGLVLYRKKKE